MNVVANMMLCCGIVELEGIQHSGFTPEGFLLSARKLVYRSYTCSYTKAVVVYSYNTEGRTRGEALTKYIKEHHLGEVLQTKPVKNPNSGHNITVCLWTIKKQNYTKWYSANKEKVGGLKGW